MATKKTTRKTTTARKATAKKATTKPTAKKAGAANAKSKRLSAIDAAAKVLTESKEPMTTKEMIEAMAAKKLWTSPSGKTPWATLYSAITREISKHGKASRFKKSERGKFALNG